MGGSDGTRKVGALRAISDDAPERKPKAKAGVTFDLGGGGE